ncbi:MAG: His/Gly/Thr/Pro-type tRNA ligase C-terminal domain-containing protein, partial [Acidimicrobiales bacterium]
GDDFGLRLPPALAPVEVVVICVREDDAVRRAAAELAEGLRRAGRRVHLDDRTDTGFGRRTVGWELKGVPVRVEVGPRDLAQGNAIVVTRHTRVKEAVALDGVVDAADRICGRVGDELRAEALAFRERRTASVASLLEAVEAGSTGFARIPWRQVGEAGELDLAAEALSVRCLQDADGRLAAPGAPDDDLVAVVGRSY